MKRLGAVILAAILAYQAWAIHSLNKRVAVWETVAKHEFVKQDERIAKWTELFGKVKDDLDSKIVVPVPTELPIGDEWIITITGKRKEQ